LSCKNLLMLVQGKGTSDMAGIWSKFTCLKSGLKAGSMIPFVAKAREVIDNKEEKFGVVIFNPNCNKLEDGTKIGGSEDPWIHIKNVWNIYLKNIKTENVYIVAHSKGGDYLVSLLSGNDK